VSEKTENKKLSGLVAREEWRLIKSESTLIRRGLDDLVRIAGQESSNENDAEAWTSKGVILAAKGLHLEALQCHEKALTIDPRCMSARLNKGYSLDELGRWPEAIESYDKAIEIDASDWTPRVRKGDLLDRAGRFEEAIHCFDSALAISPDIVSGWMGRGLAFHHLGRYEEALLCYDKALKVHHPTWTASGRAYVHSDAWNSKGTSLYRMGRYQESIECYEKAIAIDPEFGFPWYNKGNSLREMANFDEAIRCYDRAIELDPDHSRTWNNKGICLRKMGRLEDALVCCERAITCNQPEALGWYNKALIQEDLGLTEDAISSYEKYLAVAPPDQPENVKHAQERLHILKSKTKTKGPAQTFDEPGDIRRLHPDDLDAETKFYNSAFFSRYLTYATKPKTGEAREFSLLLLEFDQLKDAPVTGDVQARPKFLRELAEKVWEICAYEHWGFRIAERHFVVIMWGTSKEGALGAGNHVKSQIESANWPTGNADGIRFVVKVGVASYPSDGTSESSLMRSARSSLL
jgi:diguanylate cyclase (GGDEF)-like protein